MLTALLLYSLLLPLRFAYLKTSLNRINGKIMNSQTSTIQTKAQPNKKKSESTENISAMKRLSNDISPNSRPFRLW